MRQGLAEVETGAAKPEFVLFTDADIAYAPQVLSCLVAIARRKSSVLTSLMVKLRCESAARALARAGFRVLLSDALSLRLGQRSATRHGRGGWRLHARAARGASQGRRSRGCTGRLDRRLRFGRAHERAGADLAWVDRGASIVCAPIPPSPISAGWFRARPSPNCAIRLCASPARSAGWRSFIWRRRCSLSLRAVLREAAGALAWAMMALALTPMLRLYRRPLIGALGLPAIAVAYVAFTFESALQYWRGRGGYWKGRIQAPMRETGRA